MIAGWGAIGAMLAWAMVATRMWRRLPSLVLHASLLLILAGGLFTWLMGERGRLPLYPGEEVRAYATLDGRLKPLAEPIRLDTFEVSYYPGAVAPRQYTSRLTIGERRVEVAVNHPVTIGTMMLYQESYGADGSSVIGVNDDPIGWPLTCAGYAAFALGGLLWLLWPGKRGGGYLSLLRGVAVGVLIVIGGGAARADIAVSRQRADSLARQQVVYQGRVAPFSTVATQVMQKVVGAKSLGGYSAEQVVTSLALYPEQWRQQPLIKVDSRQLRDSLGLDRGYASVANLFTPDGDYLLRHWYRQGDERLDKAILDVDERLEIVMSLQQGKLFSPLSADQERLPGWRVETEIAYNHIAFTKVYFMAAFTVALLLIVFTLWKGVLANGGVALTLLLLAWQLTGYLMRWIISGTMPLVNAPDTLVFLSLLMLCLGLLVRRVNPLLLPLCILMSGFAALVAWLSQRNPALTPMMPVLASPWLCIHVTLVMVAYALLLLTALIAIVALALPARREELKRVSMLILYPGVFLLGLGIFTGAVWAHDSWGRYWAWDPKETWALITFMVYSVAIHRGIGWLQEPRRYHIFILCGILAVIMTYFGVNFLPSLHAYA